MFQKQSASFQTAQTSFCSLRIQSCENLCAVGLETDTSDSARLSSKFLKSYKLDGKLDYKAHGVIRG